jgi:hypothetical protein
MALAETWLANQTLASVATARVSSDATIGVDKAGAFVRNLAESVTAFVVAALFVFAAGSAEVDAISDAGAFTIAMRASLTDVDALPTRAVQASERVAFVAARATVVVVVLQVDAASGIGSATCGANRADGRRVTSGARIVASGRCASVGGAAVRRCIDAVAALTARKRVLDRAGAVVQTAAVVIAIATRRSVRNAFVAIRAAILFDSTLRDARALTVARRAIAAIGARWR